MINRFWKGFVNIPCQKRNESHDIKSIIYELNNREINSFYKMYYILKPMIPRYLQICLRRISANFIIEQGYESIEKLYHQALLECAEQAAEPFPFIWFWPNRKAMASIVTHDIESSAGFHRVLDLADIDSKYHIKSSFKFVPEGYTVDPGIMRELKRRGFEIALHGLNHDGRLFVSKKVFHQKLQKIKDYAKQWQTEGFRSPSLLRNYQLMKNFTFNWDSSFPDWDLYGPQPGGCRTIFPFFISRHTVELPVTMMQDHTLFEILKKKDITIWKEKFNYIKSLSGLANIIVHPDYIFKNNRIKYYEGYLDFIVHDETVWQTCPNEVANWWRARDRSSIKKRADGSFYVDGADPYLTSVARAVVDGGKLYFQY